MRRFAIWGSVVLFGLAGLGAGMSDARAAAESRIALVIGNGAYPSEPLRNPLNDARAMAKALRTAGFKVTYAENADQNTLKKAIRDFGMRLKPDSVGLFYYAGHGIQVNGRNYLVPISAVIDSEPEVEYESVDVGFALAQMEAAHNRLNLVILDACRNNPFARSFRSASRGLASIDAPAGTLIAYATAPGSVASDGDADHGLYTQEMLNAMRVPGLKVEDVFKRVRAAVQAKTRGKQIPWESSSLTGDFYFLPAAGSNATTLAAATPAPEPVVAIAPSTPPQRQEAADGGPQALKGEWLAEVTYDWGAKYPETFTFTVVAGEIHGSASFLGTGRGILEGQLTGNKLTFLTKTQEMLGAEGDPKEQIHRYTGEVSGAEIRFVMQTEGGYSTHEPVEFVAKRKMR